MKELYLAIAVLCFLVAIMVYCVNKSIQTLRELRDFWKKYEQTRIDLEASAKEFAERCKDEIN